MLGMNTERGNGMTKNEAIIQLQDRLDTLEHGYYSGDLKDYAVALRMAIEALKAQGTCGDAVSRQTLQKELALYPIDDITSEDEAGYNRAINDVQKMVLHLPSTQPEVTRCRDCKYASPNGVYGCRLERFSAHDESTRLFADDYCSAAERRTDESD